jgi:hypothetical protein
MAAPWSRDQAIYWPLRKHRYSIPLLLKISLFLLTVSYSVKPASAGVDHCWRVSNHVYEKVVEVAQRSECFLSNSNRNPPFRPPNYPLVLHLAAKMSVRYNLSCPTAMTHRFHYYLSTSKAVPLHAMEALRGRRGIAPTHSWPRH